MQIFTKSKHFILSYLVITLGLMLYTGYLTTVGRTEDDRLIIKIPNKEVLDSFKKKAERIFSDDNTTWLDKAIELKTALFKGDAELTESLINELLISFVSVRDTAKREDFYHGFLSGILGLSSSKTQHLKSEVDSGLGYLDLQLKDELKLKAVILEFKKVPKEESLLTVCTGALEQIEENRYAYPYEQDHYTCLKYGLAFKGKRCMVRLAEA